MSNYIPETKTERELTEELSNLLSGYHSLLFKLIKIAKKYDPNNEDIDWLQSKASLARDIDPLFIITKTKDKFWHFREQILNKDLNFLMEYKFDKFIKNDHNKTWMYTMIDLIKNKINDMSEEEKNYIWDIFKKILICVTKYKKIIGDYE